MSHYINASTAPPQIVASWRAFDGGLSLPSIGQLVIERRDNDTGLVISLIVIWIVYHGHCNKVISQLPILPVFCYKRVNFISRPHIHWFCTRASFLSYEIEIIWIFVPICREHWNTRQNCPRCKRFSVAFFKPYYNARLPQQ